MIFKPFLTLAVVIAICWLRSACFKISDYLFYLRNKALRIRAKCNWGRISMYIIVCIYKLNKKLKADSFGYIKAPKELQISQLTSKSLVVYTNYVGTRLRVF